MNSLLSKKQGAERGFTIVELLIVIVVIGILAAIVIVAYNGVQNRANTTSRNSAAENLAKKVEAFNGVKSAYPVYNTATPLPSEQLNGLTESSLAGSGITLGTPTSATNNNTVQLQLCLASGTMAAGTTATGYVIYIWDTTLTTPGLNPVQAGGTFTVNAVTGGGVNTTTPAVTATLCKVAS